MHGGNPIRPALGLHLDSALVNPVHEQKTIPDGVVIPRTLTPKSVMGEGLVADQEQTQGWGSGREDAALASVSVLIFLLGMPLRISTEVQPTADLSVAVSLRIPTGWTRESCARPFCCLSPQSQKLCCEARGRLH